MKLIIIFLFIVMCIASCTDENAFGLKTDLSSNTNFGIEEDGGIFQDKADEAYEILTSLLNEKTRSGLNDIDQWYGGSYINDEGELVIRSTDLQLSSKMYIPNTVYEECTYTLSDLKKINDHIIALYDSGDTFVLNQIVSFGINPISNSVEIGLVEDSQLNRQYFIDNISASSAVSFFKSSRIEFTSIEMKCAEDIKNLTTVRHDTIDHASLGYRARKKVTGEVGIVTAGHFISKGQFLGSLSNDTIGICVDSRNLDGVLDAAFCKITNKSYEPTNNIEFMKNPAVDTLSIKVVTPAVGSIINMVGAVSKRKAGKVLNDTYNIIDSNKTLLTDVLIMECIPDFGDSGGIVYSLYTNNSGLSIRSTVGIICGRFNKYYKIPLALPITVGICCKAEVINRLYNIERY